MQCTKHSLISLSFFASRKLPLWVLQQLDPPCFGVLIVGPSLAPLVSSFTWKTAQGINKSLDIQHSCDELFPDSQSRRFRVKLQLMFDSTSKVKRPNRGRCSNRGPLWADIDFLWEKL